MKLSPSLPSSQVSTSFLINPTLLCYLQWVHVLYNESRTLSDILILRNLAKCMIWCKYFGDPNYANWGFGLPLKQFHPSHLVSVYAASNQLMHKDVKSDQQLELVFISIQVVCANCVYNCSLPCLILRVTVGGNHFPIVGLCPVKRVQCVSVYCLPFTRAQQSCAFVTPLCGG